MKETPIFDWDSEWMTFKGLNFFGRLLYNDIEKTLNSFLKQNNLNKNITVLDFGCGKGTTLNIFRKLGYRNSIGTDTSKFALELCNKLYGFKLGKDVFLSNDKHVNQKFDLVIADGLMELYKNIANISKEISKKTRKYIVLIEPNRFSFMHNLKRLLGRNSKMYSHRLGEIKYIFKNIGFETIRVGNCNFSEHWVIFLERK